MNIFVLANVDYVDVKKGLLVKSVNLGIKDGKIASVSTVLPTSGEIVDCKGKILSPGLIDVHTHILGSADVPPYISAIRSIETCRTFLRNGIVLVRDCCNLSAKGGDTVSMEVAFAIRDQLVKDCCEVLTSGRALGPTYGRSDDFGANGDTALLVADSNDEIVKVVRYQKQIGADLIKVMATGSGQGGAPNLCYFPLDQLQLLCKEAHRLGMKVAAHTIPALGTETCIEAGVDSIEHGPDISIAYLNKMESAGITYVPTLAIYRHLAEKMPSPRRDGLKLVVEKHAKTFQSAMEVGVTIATGTDWPGLLDFGPEPRIHSEMLAMAELGMPNAEVIRAATINAASLVGEEQRLGSIEPGKDADLLLLDQNPLEDLEAYLNIAQVYKSGTPIL